VKHVFVNVVLLLLLGITGAGGADKTQENLDQAIDDASQAIHRNPKDANAYCARAGARLAKKQTKQAIADASRTIELDPENAEAYHIRGSARFLANENVAALHDLSEAIGIDPAISDAYYVRGLIRLKRSAFQKAIADFTSTIELDPNATAALLHRAEAYSKVFQFPLAIADYSELIDSDSSNAELYNRRGLARASTLDLEAAIADYTEAIRLQPEFEDAYYNRGVAYANMNAHENPNFQEPEPWGDQRHWRAAVADLSIAIVYRPDRADSYRYRGFAHNGLGENDEAIADFTEAVRLDPKGSWAHAGLADVYEMRGDLPRAEREYEVAAQLGKNDVDIFVHRSNFYWRRQNFERALKEANEAVQLAPTYPASLFARAGAYQFLKKHELALDDLTSAMEIDIEAVKPPPGWANSVRTPSQLAADYSCRGTVYEAIGDRERAIADYQEAICLEPNKALSWINLADLYKRQGDLQQAMSCYSHAIHEEPDNPLCWLGLARLLKQTGQCDAAMAALSTVFNPRKPNLLGLFVRADIEQCLGNIQGAITDYNQAIRMNPSDTQTWLDLAKLYKDAQEYDNAAATLSKILDREPTDLPARISRANLYQKLGDADKAVAEASKAIQLHPKKSEAYSARATLYNYGGNHDKAIADADHAIQLNPSDPDAYYARGFAMLQLKDYAGAIHALTEEIKLDPNHGSAWHCRGFALLKQGKYAEARADLLRAINLNLRSAELFNSLAWLLSTCPDSAVRDGIRATEYVYQALQLDPNQKDFWDTCAAVFAENGDFKNAIDWEARFLERKDLSADQRYRATERLALYRTGKPYREEPK
jgi:tetratricopeptide (TPR) repeat protein